MSQTIQATPTQTSTNGQATDPYAAVSGAVEAVKLPAIMPLRLAIVGPTGMGHSWLACTAPKPILVYDFDNRAASIRGKSGVAVKTLIDDPNSPRVIDILENDLIMIKAAKAAKQPIPATVVLDSGTYLRKCMENSLMKYDPKSIGITFKIGANKVIKSASAMTTANTIRNFFEYWVNEFGALGNIIITFHTMDEVDKDKSTKDNPVYTGKQTIAPQYLETVLSIFNDRWRINKEFTYNNSGKIEAKYFVHTRNDDQFNAITSLDIDDKEEANIETILAKHARRVQEKKTL